MWYYYFLIVIYLGYILYGLSGSLVGSIWPQMASDIAVDISLLGTINCLSYITSGIGSATSYGIRKRIGNNYTIVLSAILFIFSMLTFSLARDIIFLCIAMAVLGFGNGLIDSTSNNYVVKYHEARHVSYLHAFWGLGSTLGPMMMSIVILNKGTYNRGFVITSWILVILVIILILIKIYWENKKKTLDSETVKKFVFSEEEKKQKTGIFDAFKIKYAWIIIVCFFFCQCINGTFNTWTSTIFVTQRGITVAEGAQAATLFFAALTLGRVVIGFISSKFKTSTIIIFSFAFTLVGIVMLFVHINSLAFIYANAIVLGVGIASLIPFLNYNIKEFFGEQELPVILISVNVFGLLAIAVSSGFIGWFVANVGINYVHIPLIIFLVIAVISYFVLLKRKDIKAQEGVI